MQYHCPICDNSEPDIIEDNKEGTVICTDCGAVLDTLIDMGSEWRSFAAGDGSTGVDMNRVGAAENPLLEDRGLSTTIARDATKSAKDNHLSKANKMGATSSTDRNLIQAFKRIDEMRENMQVPMNIADRAKEIYRDVEKKKSLRGRNGESIIAATMYIACRLNNVPRTMKEIAAQTAVPQKDVGSSFNFVKKLLKLNLEMQVISAADYMTRFVSHLQFDDNKKTAAKIAQAASHVAETATQRGVVAGKSPISVAAAAIYLILAIAPPEQRRDRAVIAQVTGVSESTIRQSYKDMYPIRHELMPPPSMWTPYSDVNSLPE